MTSADTPPHVLAVVLLLVVLVVTVLAQGLASSSLALARHRARTTGRAAVTERLDG
jgi:hypothetical protein